MIHLDETLHSLSRSCQLIDIYYVIISFYKIDLPRKKDSLEKGTKLRKGRADGRQTVGTHDQGVSKCRSKTAKPKFLNFVKEIACYNSTRFTSEKGPATEIHPPFSGERH